MNGDKKERFDPPDVLREKVDQITELIRNSKHCIAFTGAGVSTSAGIPDYRSTEDTVLNTGPGRWEDTSAKGLSFEQYTNLPSKYTRVETIKALPTPSHMFIS